MKRRSPDSTNFPGLRARLRDLRPRLALLLVLLATSTGAEPQEPAAGLLDDPRWSLAFGAALEESELPGRPSFVPDPPAEPVAETDRWQALATLAADLESAYELERTAVTAHALGLFRLFARQPDDALPLLEEALAAGAGPAAENDLAVARLLRFEQQGRPEDVARAVERADRAATSLQSQEAPPAPLAFAACFTRATALERLHLSHAAHAEIERCAGLAVEPEDQRRVEERRQALGQIREAPSPWQAARQAIEQAALAGDEETVEQVMTDFLPHACAWGIDALLPAWAEARRVGDLETAAEMLTVARGVGRVLAERGSDTLLAGAVAEIDAADAGGLAGWEVALSRVGQGLAQAARDLAAQEFSAAAGSLDDLGSPLAAWAEVAAARQLLFAQSYAPAAELLWRARGRVDAERSRRLWREIERLLALLDLYAGDFAAAHQRLTALSELLASAPPAEQVPAVNLLLAEASTALGQEGEGWRLRMSALEATDAGPDVVLRNNVAYEAGVALHRAELFRAAGWVADDLLSRVPVLEPPWRAHVECEALRLRGRSRYRAGDPERGEQDFAAARAALERLDESVARERLLADLAADEARTVAVTAPARGAALVTETLEMYDQLGYHYHSPELYLLRAKAREASGDLDLAAKDYRQAVRLRAEVREKLAHPPHRRAYFDSVQAAFDAAVRFEAFTRKDPEEALELAEQARARTLLDLVSDDSQAEPFSLGRAADRMPAGVTLLSYVQLDDRLLVWRLRRDGAEMAEVSVSGTELENAVEALLELVQSGGTTAEVRPLAARLGGRLLRPFSNELAGGEPLVVVPDGALFELPFALLVDPGTDRFLIEDRAVGMAPSIALYLAQSERLGDFPPAQKRSLLAVGDPAFDPTRYGDLGRLRGARREIEQIAGYYDRKETLANADATPGRLLELLPRFQILHVAAHVLERPGLPEMSALLLADDQEAGRSGELQASSILERDLSGLEVVILSACRSVERFPRGREGVAGAARPFLEAGVPVVVASLWPVDDQATVALMKAFHRRLAKGLDAAEALRQAQVELLEADEPAAPGVWAAFEVVGGLLPR